MLFTSESVSEGHPDKLADQMSDAILDAILIQDPKGRVACDILVKNNTVIIAGEITTIASIDIDGIIREVANKIGYTKLALGFDAASCHIVSLLSKQSSDIAHAIESINPKDQRAGDQGTLFGYASDETDALMPAPILYAHRLMERQAYLRKSKKISWIGPDAKVQVTLRYIENRPVEVMSIVFSTQHNEEVDSAVINEMVREEIIQCIFPREWLTKNTRYYINPAGRFVIGGPASDCGLTGRKIAVDSYGGFSRDGGGCFSGKDPSKVDRSGAYMARYIAKNLVAAGLAKRCEIQISYAIGVSDPIALNVETFGTGSIQDDHLKEIILNKWDLRPFSIIQFLQLERPIYFQTAAYGHFGRPEFPWEQIQSISV